MAIFLAKVLLTVLFTLSIVVFQSSLKAQNSEGLESPGIGSRVINRTDFLIGGSGGTSFGSDFIGPAVEIEAPIGTHFEVDSRASASWLGKSFGHGYSAAGGAGPSLWLRPKFGMDGFIEFDRYSVTGVSKSDVYWYSGAVLRTSWWSNPTKLYFDYFRSAKSWLAPGTTPNHLQGGWFRLESELGCSKHACYRMTLESSVGHLYEQGGQGAIGGSAVGGFLVEIPRREGF